VFAFACLASPALAQAPQPVTPPMRADPIAPLKSVPRSIADVRMSFAPVVERAAPAVVNIYTSRVVSRSTGDPFFDRFFGVGPERQNSLGSGVILSPDGVIATNNHVIDGMQEIKVVLSDRREFVARVLLADSKTDLAVLKIDAPEKLPFLEYANSDAAEVGDVVLAIGNPFGVGQTVTSGIVSALARTAVAITDYQFFIQTDAAINPGNSGGALIDVDGRLLGVNTAIFSRSGGSNGVGFAIPSRLVRQVIAQATNGGAIRRPWLGASSETVTPDLARAVGLDRPVGAIIGEVYPGGPAAKAGLKEGDVVVEIAGQPVFDAETLHYRVGIEDAGKTAPVIFMRAGKRMSSTFAFAPPPATPAKDERALAGDQPLASAKVANLSPALNEELGLNPMLAGVVITEVAPGSFAARQRVRPGYRVLSVNGRSVQTTAQLAAALAAPSPRWVIEIDTGDRVVAWRVGR
jgi:serine protease Do